MTYGYQRKKHVDIEPGNNPDPKYIEHAFNRRELATIIACIENSMKSNEHFIMNAGMRHDEGDFFEGIRVKAFLGALAAKALAVHALLPPEPTKDKENA